MLNGMVKLSKADLRILIESISTHVPKEVMRNGVLMWLREGDDVQKVTISWFSNELVITEEGITLKMIANSQRIVEFTELIAEGIISQFNLNPTLLSTEIEFRSLTVLDFNTAEVHCYQYPAEIKDVELWIIDNTPHRINSCQYLTANTLKLQVHGTLN